MIVLNGYSLIYDKYHNKITIYLPQTEHSLNSTVLPVSRNRRYDVDENELNALLSMAQMIFEEKTGKWDSNRCSECGFGVLLNPYMHNLDTGEYTLLYKFCPNCGARMEG